MAIIDQPLLVEHQEYKDRLRLYEEIHVKPDTEASMHGPAVASIAVGKTIGVAPEADLYYIGSWTGDLGDGGSFIFNFKYYAQAIHRILEVNRQLPADRKIKIIAMQVGWIKGQSGYNEITAASNEAKAAGLFVVSSSLEEVHGFKFNGLGRSPLADPDKFESYEPGLFWANKFWREPSIPVSRPAAHSDGFKDFGLLLRRQRLLFLSLGRLELVDSLYCRRLRIGMSSRTEDDAEAVLGVGFQDGTHDSARA